MIIPKIRQTSRHICDRRTSHQTCKEPTQHNRLQILRRRNADQKGPKDEIGRQKRQLASVQLRDGCKQLSFLSDHLPQIICRAERRGRSRNGRREKAIKLTNGPNANPKTYNESVKIVTSELTPNSAATAPKVGENDEEANEAPMVVKPSKSVTPTRYLTDQFYIYNQPRFPASPRRPLLFPGHPLP